jgi:hypothetical protein
LPLSISGGSSSFTFPRRIVRLPTTLPQRFLHLRGRRVGVASDSGQARASCEAAGGNEKIAACSHVVYASYM